MSASASPSNETFLAGENDCTEVEADCALKSLMSFDLRWAISAIYDTEYADKTIEEV
jgi:hypothetical protein